MRRSVFAGGDDINELVSYQLDTPLHYLALQKESLCKAQICVQWTGQPRRSAFGDLCGRLVNCVL